MRDQPPEPPDPDDEPGPAGRLRPTSPAVLTAWAVVGLVGGWLLHPVAERLGTPPLVTWGQPLALWLVVAILGATAWSTWRTVHVHRVRLDAQQAVNRLVLARACAYVGALVGGGYLGYGLTWLGDSAELADERLWRSLLAAAAGAGVTVAGLLLERACRVRSDGREP